MDAKWFQDLAVEAIREAPYPDPRFPPSKYYRLLRLLAQRTQPRLSVELGVCGGGGSLHLALGWPAGAVIGVDFARDHPENVAFVEACCPNFTFWLGDSVLSADVVSYEYGPVDILFIDTIHTTERTQAELEAWRPYLGEHAVVCFDDLFRKEMVGFWESLPEPKLRIDVLHDGAESGGGFGLIWK